jgi:hypothetical protein
MQAPRSSVLQLLCLFSEHYAHAAHAQPLCNNHKNQECVWGDAVRCTPVIHFTDFGNFRLPRLLHVVVYMTEYSTMLRSLACLAVAVAVAAADR